MIEGQLYFHARLTDKKMGTVERYTYKHGDQWLIAVSGHSSLAIYRVVNYDDNGLAMLESFHHPDKDIPSRKSGRSRDKSPPHTPAG